MFCKKDIFLHHSQVQEDHVSAYLSGVWNNAFTDQMSSFLHPMFVDYSMPFHYLQNAIGVKSYLHILKRSIHLHLEVEALASCGEYVYAALILHVAPMHLVNNHTTETSRLFSIFRFQDDQIISHWQTEWAVL